MPFKSKAQMRFLYKKHPKIAEEFAKETKDFKNLPERVKKAMDESFSKIAKELFNPVKSPPVPARVTQQQAIQSAKETKTQGMSPVEYRNEMTSRRTGIVQKNKQSNKSV